MMATVEEGPNGEIILNDPMGLAVARAVEKHNCRLTFEANADRVSHFRNRCIERGDDPASVCIVLANVDDPHGGILAEALMPGFDWGPIRAKGEVPFARGLANRQGVHQFLTLVDAQASFKLAAFSTDPLPVVVVDHGVCEVF